MVTEKAIKRIIKLLNANYVKADLQQVVKKTIHLSEEQRNLLYNLLLILICAVSASHYVNIILWGKNSTDGSC